MPEAKKECPGCAVEIDADEKVCPICGYEFPQISTGKKVVAWLMIILLFFWLVL